MKLIGYDKLIKDLRALGVDGEKRIAQTTEANARDIEVAAKQTAASVSVIFDGKRYGAFDLGTLYQDIRSYTSIESRGTFWKIEANANGRAPYSAYVEFGSGGQVEVPEEMMEMAKEFEGDGIRNVELPARPYLYPSFVKGREKYIKDLTDDLNDLTKNI